MKKTNGNYMKVTIYRIKISSDTSITNYSLKMDFCKQSCETEKISVKDFEMGGKSYFFDLPPGVKPTSLEISAVSKTLFIFDSHFAKVSIPVNINKLDDKREWYYLKNSKEENVISILTSIYCELKSEKSINIDNSLHINSNKSYITPYNSTVMNNKNDMSYDVNRNNNTNNYFSNVINRSYGPNCVNNNYTIDEIKLNRNKHKSEEKFLDNTVVYNENYKSPDISNITNNLFSPCSYRLDPDKSNINYNILNMTNLNSKLNNSVVNFNPNNKHNLTTDINNYNDLNCTDLLDLKLNEEKFSDEQCEIMKKIKLKIKQISNDEENIRKMNEDIVRDKERIRHNESKIHREKEKIELYVKNFKAQKLEFENKSNCLNENYVKFNFEVNKFNSEKELFDYQKKLFIDLNFILNSGTIMNNIHSANDKIKEVNKKLSINNRTQKISTGVTNSPGSQKFKINENSINSIKKELIYETPLNIIYSSKSKDREYSRDKYSTGSVELQTNPNTLDKDRKIGDKSNLNNLNTDQLNQSCNQLINNFNSNKETCSIIQKTLNNSGNFLNNSNMKFYTPIAQIDLNKQNKNIGSQIPVQSTFDISIPKNEKINYTENKLIDSLDNMNFLYSKSNNLNLNEKKNKFRRAGSDEQKAMNKKTDEKKKTINKYTSTNSNLINNHNNSTTNLNSINQNNSNLLTLSTNNISTPNIILKEKKIALGYAKNSLEKSLVRKELCNTNVTQTNILTNSNKSEKVISNLTSSNNITYSNYKLSSLKKNKI